MTDLVRRYKTRLFEYYATLQQQENASDSLAAVQRWHLDYQQKVPHENNALGILYTLYGRRLQLEQEYHTYHLLKNYLQNRPYYAAFQGILSMFIQTRTSEMVPYLDYLQQESSYPVIARIERLRLLQLQA